MTNKRWKGIVVFISIFIISILSLTDVGRLMRWEEEGLSRKLGFGLMTYSEESVNGIMELMDKIYSEEHCFMMHFDKKTPQHSVELFVEKYPTVKLTKERFDISWGSFALVRAQLELAQIECDYDHLVYLDGMSYPMRPISHITRELAKIPRGHSIVFSNDPGYGSTIPTCKQGSPTLQACSRSFATCMDPECTKYTNTPGNGPIYKGPQWSILSRDFIKYMFNNRKMLDEWMQFFDSSYMISDEAFFPTLLMNSPFRNHHFLFQQDWMRTVWLDCRTEHTELSSIGWSPCLLGLKDYEPHLQASTSLFTRKIKVGSDLKMKIFEKYKEPFKAQNVK